VESHPGGRGREMSRLAREVEACAKCGLAAGRTRVVVGEGCLEGGVVLVGEAPGRREDEAGRPFVGYAGRVLDQLLEEAGLSRLEVYMCRPPGNRRPRKGEVQACSGYLERQLRILEPKVVATLGNTSLAFFQERYGLTRQPIGKTHGKPRLTRQPIGKTHGKPQPVEEEWGIVFLLPLYHPAAAIYNRSLRDTLLEDLRVLSRLRLHALGGVDPEQG